MMLDALTALQKRVSSPRLVEPAPDHEQLQAIFASALRAADHGLLRPWRFLVITDTGREQLGELMASAALQDDPALSEREQTRVAQKTQRAPMIVVAIASCRENGKIPVFEQHLSAGAAVQNILTATFALGLGAYWRTGSLAYHPQVAKGLGLKSNEQVIGFIYLGTPAGVNREAPVLEVQDFVDLWPNK